MIVSHSHMTAIEGTTGGNVELSTCENLTTDLRVGGQPFLLPSET